MRARVLLSAVAVSALLLPTGAAAATKDDNPCVGPGSGHLLCPDLRIGPPSDFYLSGYGDDLYLHATSDVRSRGRGPMEVRGRRDGPRTMRTNQRIHRAGGGRLTVRSAATLRFTDVGYGFGGAYWKVHQLARFELRRVGPSGRRGPVLRTSPKLNYCLRDLERTRPGRRSPAHRHYPACSQDRRRHRVTLGTSVGWSDIYPADYDRQWIEVTDLRGCFAYEMTVDPKDLLFESNERDNTSRRLVRLPFHGEPGC